MKSPRTGARLLLDTHVLIWWDTGRDFAAKAMAAIRDADQVYVSAASAWEMAIKASLGRIETDRRLGEVAIQSGFEELPIRISHAEAVETLPPHHRDPFDRILVAQASVEGLVLVTRDQLIRRYDVEVLDA
ncbi:MAG TPA: type II toxin-antitoxin system VapC family toxin [Longimicrobiales bacterium]|nr:type II toxin-antitoxin system VapC family toxin [Longimicrobiales bacterium]